MKKTIVVCVDFFFFSFFFFLHLCRLLHLAIVHHNYVLAQATITAMVKRNTELRNYSGLDIQNNLRQVSRISSCNINGSIVTVTIRKARKSTLE